MSRTFELKASANSAGYCVTLRINGRAFTANAVVGDTAHDAYGRFAAELQDVYGELYEKRWEYEDILHARDRVFDVICALHGLVGGA